jgi:hypothetical protein
VGVTIHCYRHRYGNARGEVDPATLTGAMSATCAEANPSRVKTASAAVAMALSRAGCLRLKGGLPEL